MYKQEANEWKKENIVKTENLRVVYLLRGLHMQAREGFSKHINNQGQVSQSHIKEGFGDQSLSIMINIHFGYDVPSVH